MIVPQLSGFTFNTDASIGVLTDLSVYGGANPERTTVVVYLQVWKMDKNSVATEQVISNSTPEVVTSWSINTEVDGWYRTRQYIINDYDNAVSYNEGDVIYYDTVLYIAEQATSGNLPTNPVFWSAITSFTDAASAANVITAYKDYLVIEQGKACAGNAVGKWADSANCGGCDKANLLAQWYQKDAIIYAAIRFASINQFSKAEELTRKLQNLCETC